MRKVACWKGCYVWNESFIFLVFFLDFLHSFNNKSRALAMTTREIMNAKKTLKVISCDGQPGNYEACRYLRNNSFYYQSDDGKYT